MIQRQTYLTADRPCNRGISLVEMAAAIAICAVLSGIAVVMMASLFQLDQSTNHHMAQRAALRQLSTMLRKDIHQAIDCRWNADSRRLVLEHPQQQRVEYAVGDNRWVRIASRQDDRPVTTAYPLDAACRWSCQPPQAGPGALLHVDIGTPAVIGPTGSRPALQCAVVAVVGRDHQLFHDHQ